jgi:hypothetical protein
VRAQPSDAFAYFLQQAPVHREQVGEHRERAEEDRDDHARDSECQRLNMPAPRGIADEVIKESDNEDRADKEGHGSRQEDPEGSAHPRDYTQFEARSRG